MEMKVNLTEEEEIKLLERAKNEVRNELTEESLKAFIKSHNDIDVLELIRTFNIYYKYEDLKDIPVKNLTRNEKFICVLHWLIYEKLVN